jgi:Rrf2 family transcriptional regulator, cysteine metabolism repressor
MKISKKSQYGLRALVFLARNRDKVLSLRSISEKEKIPFNYLEKIFSQLEKKRLINSKKGVQGGYTLAVSPEKIKVGEVIKALEGEIILVECVGSKSNCVLKKSCKTISAWRKIQESLEKTINSISLKDLIN